MGKSSMPYLTKAVFVITAIAVAAPLVSRLADYMGYKEPLDLAASMLGLSEHSITWFSPLAGYKLPGLPWPLGEAVSIMLGSAAVAVATIVLLGALAWLRRRGER